MRRHPRPPAPSGNRASTICPEFAWDVREPPAVRRERYDLLHPEGHALIEGWYRHARRLHEAGAGVFEPFIFTWIAINAWGACVTDEDRDRYYVVGLAADQHLQHSFQELLQSNPAFESAANAFAELWPIFKVKELRRLRLLHRRQGTESRSARVSFYLSNGAREVAPDCWLRHLAEGSRPVDWPHTLSAIYRVRNNLFHGEKSAHSEMDRRIVAAAYQVLVRFVGGTNLLGTE